MIDGLGAFESAPTAKGAVNAVGLGFGDTADVAEHGITISLVVE